MIAWISCRAALPGIAGLSRDSAHDTSTPFHCHERGSFTADRRTCRSLIKRSQRMRKRSRHVYVWTGRDHAEHDFESLRSRLNTLYEIVYTIVRTKGRCLTPKQHVTSESMTSIQGWVMLSSYSLLRRSLPDIFRFSSRMVQLGWCMFF